METNTAGVGPAITPQDLVQLFRAQGVDIRLVNTDPRHSRTFWQPDGRNFALVGVQGKDRDVNAALFHEAAGHLMTGSPDEATAWMVTAQGSQQFGVDLSESSLVGQALNAHLQEGNLTREEFRKVRGAIEGVGGAASTGFLRAGGRLNNEMGALARSGWTAGRTAGREGVPLTDPDTGEEVPYSHFFPFTGDGIDVRLGKLGSVNIPSFVEFFKRMVSKEPFWSPNQPPPPSHMAENAGELFDMTLGRPLGFMFHHNPLTWLWGKWNGMLDGAKAEAGLT